MSRATHEPSALIQNHKGMGGGQHANPVLTIDGSIELTEPVELTEEEMEKIAGGRVTADRASIIRGAIEVGVGALLVGTSGATAGIGGVIGGAVIGAGVAAITGDIH